MGCGDTSHKGGAGLGDLRRRRRAPVTVTLSKPEVERMTDLLTTGSKPFRREVDLRLLIMRLAVWSEEQSGVVQASEMARERFFLPDGTINPNVIVDHETREET
jgi:hypothetical protein